MSRINRTNNVAVALKKQMPVLVDLLTRVQDHWVYEDKLYRFYHGRYKVYDLQNLTEEIVSALQALMPKQQLNEMFMTIIHEGTGKVFTTEDNQRWLEAARPIIEAFFHARSFLEMAVKYGKNFDSEEGAYRSGSEALLTLYDLW